ncbi:MAG: hypothetical protein QM737_20150 [Ferruginibacter sp.]
MENLPVYISIIFGLITLLTLFLFYKAANKSKRVLAVIGIWLLLQAIVASTGFYTVTNTIPPRFLFLLMPPLVLISLLFVTSIGRNFIDKLDIRILTLLHVIRIPVEIVLLLLFLNKTIPGIMTFEGRNFDILSGITAIMVWYFGFYKNKLSEKLILFWNIACLVLLFNIVIIAILSAPFSFQQFGFDQPNIAILYFPFVWLPCFVVPAVLFSHLVAIRRLIYRTQIKNAALLA